MKQEAKEFVRKETNLGHEAKEGKERAGEKTEKKVNASDLSLLVHSQD